MIKKCQINLMEDGILIFSSIIEIFALPSKIQLFLSSVMTPKITIEKSKGQHIEMPITSEQSKILTFRKKP